MTTANTATGRRAAAALGLAAALLAAGCSSLPQPPARADVYDFGPPAAASAPEAGAKVRPSLAPIALAEVGVSGMPEGSAALLYRLAYANAQQLRPYTQARWSQPPAALMGQALRERLGERRPVLFGSEGQALKLPQGGQPTVLRVELEEFSQVFTAPDASHALVRARAVLADASAAGETFVAHRVFTAQRPATTANAAGGARALSEAAAQIAGEVAGWVEQQGR